MRMRGGRMRIKGRMDEDERDEVERNERKMRIVE